MAFENYGKVEIFLNVPELNRKVLLHFSGTRPLQSGVHTFMGGGWEKESCE